MAVATHATPIEAPLPGGRDGATVRVSPLLAGEMLAPPRFWDGATSPVAFARTLATPRSRWRWLPIPAFLVEHPEAGPILIDTGFDASVAEDPARDLGRGVTLMSRIRMEPELALPAQLRARGIDPEDVRLVVMTHLHYDHASGATGFPGAMFVCDRREWDAASSGGFTDGYRREHLDAALDWRTLDLDGPAAGPSEGFARTLDLLGDGSVVLVSTRGHTHGHLSVLLRLSGGPLLLTADAAYARRTIDERLVPLFLSGSRGDYERSLAEIAGWVSAHPTAPVICGHDPWSWPALAELYQ